MWARGSGARVLCGSVDMDMLACAVPNGKHIIRIQSEGYPALSWPPARRAFSRFWQEFKGVTSF